ncbi:MAG: hypothetical protein A2043_00970 [Candidatus Schekmanbacteria bacterium GWA2_38_9]|nr:MAG: hypothetical protein A2043_00970 [Candidatus Schekmanbacteria bacterium GWA2_38_9]
MERKIFFIVLSLLLVLGFLVYGNSFKVPFHYDDRVLILENENLHSLERFFKKEFPSSNRPVLMLSFALNYSAGGVNPAGYHLVNLIIHILTAFLIYLITLGLLLKKETEKNPDCFVVAILASLIFLIHPLATESATYISSRSSLMSCFFYLLSLYFFVKGSAEDRESIVFSSACIFSFLMALGSKEIAITLPLITVLSDYYFISDGDRKKIFSNFRRFHLPLAISAIVVILLKFSYAIRLESPDRVERGFYSHILSTAYALIFYLKKFFLPLNLNIDPDFKIFDSVFHSGIVVILFAALMLLITAVKLYPEKKIISFSIIWFFITLSPHFLIRLRDIGAERWLYLSLAGFGFFSAGLFVELKNVFQKKGKNIFVGSILLIIFLFSATTIARNKVWENGISLWADAVKKSPNKFRPYNNLGEAYSAMGEIDMALQEYEIASRLNPMADRVHYNLGNAYSKKGEIDPAIASFTRATELNPSYAKAYNNLGSIYLNNGNLQKAEEMFLKTVKILPDFKEAYNNLGNVYSEMGLSKEAISEYKKAIDINKYYDTPHYNLAREFYKSGSLEEAIKELEIASKLSPKIEYSEKLHELKNIRGMKN